MSIAGKTPEQIAAEMVPDPVLGEDDETWWCYLEEPLDWPDADYHAIAFASESQPTPALLKVDLARGIIARLVERVREESAAEIQRLRGALLWFADEGHYTGTYRRGAGFVDAVGLTKAREALGLRIDRDDGSEMPLAEALALLEEDAPASDPECPGEHCMMCTGEACNLCGAGCWNNNPEEPCEHDVLERHEEPLRHDAPASEPRPRALPAGGEDHCRVCWVSTRWCSICSACIALEERTVELVPRGGIGFENLRRAVARLDESWNRNGEPVLADVLVALVVGDLRDREVIGGSDRRLVFLRAGAGRRRRGLHERKAA